MVAAALAITFLYLIGQMCLHDPLNCEKAWEIEFLAFFDSIIKANKGEGVVNGMWVS